MALSLSFSSCLYHCSYSHQGQGPIKKKKKNNNWCIVKSSVAPSITSSPLQSLQRGNWVKLICGASFEDVVDIRNLSLVYTLTGVDCIDCAADASVVHAVNQGIQSATQMAVLTSRPWVMISVNDDEDLHFRKAEFDPEDCPVDCSRPCEFVCPANAIPPQDTNTPSESGVITERCYGCGQCFPVCPYDKIREITYVRDVSATAELIKRDDVDAIEIHTSGRQIAPFRELWDGLGDSIQYLRLVAVSLPSIGDSTVSAMNSMYSIMDPQLHDCFNLWQLDGRPMSGDIERGATRETIAFAVRLAARRDKPPGFLQLAGGTNAHTVKSLQKEGLFQRTLETRGKWIDQFKGRDNWWSSLWWLRKKDSWESLEMYGIRTGAGHIEDHPEYLEQAVKEALALVGTVKCYYPIQRLNERT